MECVRKRIDNCDWVLREIGKGERGIWRDDCEMKGLTYFFPDAAAAMCKKRLCRQYFLYDSTGRDSVRVPASVRYVLSSGTVLMLVPVWLQSPPKLFDRLGLCVEFFEVVLVPYRREESPSAIEPRVFIRDFHEEQRRDAEHGLI